jgi:predicted ABC-type ATPase
MTENKKPKIIVIGGCNGSGKSTIAPHLLRDSFELNEFVNADTIAQGLSAYSPESVAFEAGRLMLLRLRDLAKKRKSFAFETTLATRFYARWITELKSEGFKFNLIFLWLKSPELAHSRVKHRVSLGGHNIPKDVIYRRYHKGLKNFFNLYKPIADNWVFYNNSTFGNADIIAEGSPKNERIINLEIWSKLCEQAELK